MSNLAKYETAHPLKRALLRRFLKRARAAVGAPQGPVLDVGAGEGMFWEDGFEGWVAAVDIRHDALQAGRDRVGFFPIVGDAGRLPFAGDAFDTVVAVEVLEHLANPAAAASEVARVCRRRAVITVPWEPLFSLAVLAGTWRHWRRLGREPEHVNAFGPRDLRALLTPHFSAVSVFRCFPWLVAAADV